MKLVIQRCRHANVRVNHQIVGEISSGMVVFSAIENDDNEQTIDKVIQKLLKLRIFSPENGKMDVNVQDISGGILLISQFTLSADLKRGNRPSFDTGIKPTEAKLLYDLLVQKMKKAYSNVAQGIFATDMQVNVENDGPATFLINIT